MKKKRVLYITYDGLTDPLGQSQILPYICGLAEQGYQFTILSFEKKDRYARESGIINTICEKYGINWVPLMFTSKPPVLSKMYDRWRMRRMVDKLDRQHGFDMIHCRSYIAAEMGLRMKRKKQIPFFFDMRGFWADEKVDGGQWNLKNPLFKRIYRHYKQKEKEFLLEADAIVSLTDAARKELLSKPEYKNLDIRVIPCCADLEHFDYRRVTSHDTEQRRNELNIPGESRVISYLGSVGGWYMTKEMFDFFLTLRAEHPDFLLLILSKDDPELIRQWACDAQVPETSLRICFAKRADLPSYISLSQCSIFFIRPTYSKMASSPTKHAELMGMGIPVICNDLGDTGLIMEKTNTGAVVKSFDAKSYQSIVDRIDDIVSISPSHIREAAFEYFDLQKGVESYLKIYQEILS